MADPAIRAAAIKSIKGSARELHAEQSHARQQQRINQRATVNAASQQQRHKYKLSELGSRRRNATKQAAANAQVRVDASRSVMAEREGIRAAHQTENVQRRETARVDTRNRKIAGAVAGKVVSTATPSGNSNLLMTTMFVMVGLVLFYLLVTSAGAASGFLGTLGDLLHRLSSFTPLFSTVPNPTGAMVQGNTITPATPSAPTTTGA